MPDDEKLKLYTKDDRFSDMALALDKEACEVLAPIFKQYVDLGYSIRDISHVIMGAVTSLELEHVLCWDDKAKKVTYKQ